MAAQATANLIDLDDGASIKAQQAISQDIKLGPQKATTLWDNSQHKSTIMERARISSGYNPFDELARATPPPNAPINSQGSYGSSSPAQHDPLHGLWPDPLGAMGDRPAAHLSSPQGSEPTAANRPSQHAQHTRPQQAHHIQQGLGDMLQWDFDFSPPSETSTGTPAQAIVATAGCATGGLACQSLTFTASAPVAQGATAQGHHRASSSIGDLLNMQGPGEDTWSRHVPSKNAPAHSKSSNASPEPSKSHGPPQKPHGPQKSDEAAGASSQNGESGEVPAVPVEQRELHIYAIPLTRDRLVFLPIAAWQEEPKAPRADIVGHVDRGLTKIGDNVTSMWSSMGSKNPSSFQHKIHKHGTEIMESMSAEERLMRNIPKHATKVVVHHPASLLPSEVQEQLQTITSNFRAKATGKAAAAGLLLPVAVGLEIIALPGTGWIALYQLYKASVSVVGGQRLNTYLNSRGPDENNVRVCYAGCEELDKYIEQTKLNLDGLLTQDDVDDLCHDLGQDGLLHPLTELRSRYLKRSQQKTGDYALLPANDNNEESGLGSHEVEPPKKKLFGLW
mmetsp:Transcript_7104/g.12190  ORF Transcript_7104/g.12190 Transcript_7104/m.12190 type:complete len:563 (+) Transcript_7104:212-1900(+)|eukprot:CAMPEP_0119105314 /NCGR_PEP_ID=MMETSP1180-20130426/3306_1 /TAXON_ID=3052 ORGANISM="Chlamydomonas cf sp, Strain CCMP681" /NCGR_SAMPLE_ID=MMETSP1180 /ASSEMBLY_ACC=CAM_ASM_000741 /LENGTH=562 /DNA_ID=CAMNT_0007090329 /DNA_START=152 /DNA_END=1840 /DNA_ORIENTATION=+